MGALVLVLVVVVVTLVHAWPLVAGLALVGLALTAFVVVGVLLCWPFMWIGDRLAAQLRGRGRP